MLKKKNKLYIYFSCLLIAFIMFVSLGVTVNADSWSEESNLNETFVYDYYGNDVYYYKKSFYDFDTYYIEHYYNNSFYRSSSVSSNMVIEDGYNPDLNNQMIFTQGDGTDPWVFEWNSQNQANDYDKYMLFNRITFPYSKDIYVNEIVFEKRNFWLTLEMIENINGEYSFFNSIFTPVHLFFDLDYDITFNDGTQSNGRSGTIMNKLILDVYPNNDILGISEFSNNTEAIFVESLRYRVYNFSLPCFIIDSYIPFISTEAYSYYYDDILENYRSQVVDNASPEDIGTLGTILLNSANSFLQFEIVQNFTLLNLLFVVVAIPLLIWILKLFLGG